MVQEAWRAVGDDAEEMEMGDKLTIGLTGVGITFMF